MVKAYCLSACNPFDIVGLLFKKADDIASTETYLPEACRFDRKQRGEEGARPFSSYNVCQEGLKKEYTNV